MENRIVYLAFKRNDGEHVYKRGFKYIDDHGSLVSFSLGGKFCCVTTTMACIKHNHWEEDLEYEFSSKTYHQEPTELMLNYYNNK